ncbi:hypothetical protein JW977_02410 [Candidatus Falkowbacteria bacterium]|nr:hypothetical protein [Candidatus Falkowbacteria bacterium]
MARKKSEFLKAAGKMWAMMQAITNAVLEMGGGDDDMHRLLTDSQLVKQIAELIMSGRQKVSDTYKVVVDYSKSLTEMIQLGNYGYVNDDITDRHFPIQGSGQHEAELVLVHLNKDATTKEVLVQGSGQYEAELVLVHLNKDATTKEVLANLDEMGLKPAKIEHQLALGALRPELQKEFPIVALGSVWVDGRGDRHYPYLDFNDDKRKLRLDWDARGSHWYDYCRFLALRK